jgi:hypothetical protein
MGDYWGNTSSESLNRNFTDFDPFQTSCQVFITDLRSPLHVDQYYSAEYLNRRILEAGYYTLKAVKGAEVILGYPNEQITKYAQSDYFHSKWGRRLTSKEGEEAVKDLHLGKFKKCFQFLNNVTGAASSHHRNTYAREAAWVELLRHTLSYAGILHTVHDQSVFGESDLLVVGEDFIYILEVKLTKKYDLSSQVAKDAIAQIINKGYGNASLVQAHKSLGKKVKYLAAVAAYEVRSSTEKARNATDGDVIGDEVVGWSTLLSFDPETKKFEDDMVFTLPTRRGVQ